ncbi:MAG: glycosyltransferase family 4 protein [Thermomonas sp.]|uniref:glycosyltransferase family 4 protein n=1 Tax=Thermomonas sp. TaxID=1971895 RepID=UPI0039E310C2
MADSSVRRKRVMLITRNLPPLVGGMERLNWHMADELANVSDVCVIGPQGSAALAPENVQVVEVPLKPLWKFLLSSWIVARREARRFRPDIVLAGSGLTAPLARAAARFCGARAHAYVHGLDVAVKHPVYRAIWLRALRRMDGVIANSGPTAMLCRNIGIHDDKLCIVHPGVDLPKQESRPVRQLSGSPILLSVGRLSTRKGLREFVTNTLPIIVAKYPNALLLVVGDAPKQALHAEAQTPQSIQAAADAAGVGGNIRFLGVITDYQALGDIYRACDVHVFPVRELPGDPEGFGMVAVEAAAHGLPTVAFATGGIVDAVAEGQSGYLVPPGDYAVLSDAILRVLSDGDGCWKARAEQFAQGFAWAVFGEKLQAALTINERQ